MENVQQQQQSQQKHQNYLNRTAQCSHKTQKRKNFVIAWIRREKKKEMNFQPSNTEREKQMAKENEEAVYFYILHRW